MSRLFLNDTTTAPTYALSLHDALPISLDSFQRAPPSGHGLPCSLLATSWLFAKREQGRDRKSTRLNSSHEWISYPVCCLKKKRRTSAGASDTDGRTKTRASDTATTQPT